MSTDRQEEENQGKSEARQGEWFWTDREDKQRTKADLEAILAEHKLWIKSRKTKGAPADLRGALLWDAELTGAELTRADLSGTQLWNADLTHAKLSKADLGGADLSEANLSNAVLTHANLNNATLNSANLSEANLRGVHLHKADLYSANLNRARLACAAEKKEGPLICADLADSDLSGASLNEADFAGANLGGTKLNNADLRDAWFSGADLERAVFEPKLNPNAVGIAEAKNLESLTFRDNPNPLAQLRKQFQDGGFRTQERKITYALNRRQAELDGPIERWFKRVAFDSTCQYGMNPGRALQIWVGLFFVSWVVYAALIHTSGESGIFRVQRSDKRVQGELVEEQIRPQEVSSQRSWQYPLGLVRREGVVILWAGFFSLRSALNIGFRDINFGEWLRLLTKTEYDLKAKGWARTVAGFQSLISVYLMALWVLTYFGRPFE